MEKLRLIICSLAVGLTFSICTVIGGILQDNRYLSYFRIYDGVNIVLIGIFSALIVALSYVLLDKLGNKEARVWKVGQNHSSDTRKFYKLFFFTALVIITAYTVAFLASFPGVFSYDAPHQVWQFVTGNIGNNQPVICSWIIYSIMYVGKSVFGSWEGGVATYIILQIIFATVTFSVGLVLLYQKTCSKLMYGIGFAFYALHPMNQLFVVNCAKDVAYSYFFVWLVMIFGEALPGRGKSLKQKVSGVFLSGRLANVLLIFFMLMFLFYRNNSIYVLVAFFIPALLYYKNARKQLAIQFFVVMFIYFFITGVIYDLCGWKSNNVAEMMAVPEQQLANTYIKHGETFTQEELDVVFSVLPEGTVQEYEQMYVPENSDFIRPHINKDGLKKVGMVRFLKTYMTIGIKHPVSYLEAALNNTRGYWYVFYDISGVGSDHYIEYVNSSYDAGIHTDRKPVLQKLGEWYYDVGQNYSLGKLPGFSWFFSIASTFLIGIYLIGYILYKKCYSVLIACCLPIALYITIILGPLPLLRYVYPATLCLPYLFAVALNAHYIQAKET